MIRLEQNHIVMHGMATAHSHAFQRALRGRTHRKATQSGNFWSWRDQMFRLVEQLTPEHVFNISRFAFVELAMSGVTAVGEFHYVHHGVGGAPYANRLELTDAVLRAANAAGIRISLIRTGYYRAGFNQTLHAGQTRFCDGDVADTLRDLDELRTRPSLQSSTARLAVAAHSIRACTAQQITALHAYAKTHGLPFHMHVSEQRREIDECVQEYGVRPVDLLHTLGVLDKKFVGVHCTHLAENEIALLGAARSTACICRTTERDLGDGLPLSSALLAAGACLCVGVDSHAASDAFEEVRAVELDDRVRHEKRMVAAEPEALLEIATRNGYDAIGMGDVFGQDHVWLHADDAALAGIDTVRLSDAVMMGANPRAVDNVFVAGKHIVKNGRHVIYDQALSGYLESLNALGWL